MPKEKLSVQFCSCFFYLTLIQTCNPIVCGSYHRIVPARLLYAALTATFESTSSLCRVEGDLGHNLYSHTVSYTVHKVPSIQAHHFASLNSSEQALHAHLCPLSFSPQFTSYSNASHARITSKLSDSLHHSYFLSHRHCASLPYSSFF